MRVTKERTRLGTTRTIKEYADGSFVATCGDVKVTAKAFDGRVCTPLYWSCISMVKTRGRWRLTCAAFTLWYKPSVMKFLRREAC